MALKRTLAPTQSQPREREVKNIPLWLQERISFLHKSTKNEFDSQRVEEEEKDITEIINQLTKFDCWSNYIKIKEQEIRANEKIKALESHGIDNTTKMTIDNLLFAIDKWIKYKKSKAIELEFQKIMEPLACISLAALESKNTQDKLKKYKEKYVKSLSKERRELERKEFLLKYKIYSTRGEGDCGLHAMLGEWSEKNKCYEYSQVAKARETIRNEIIKRQNQKIDKCVIENLKKLIISDDDRIGEEAKALRHEYRNFIRQEEKEAEKAWAILEAKLNKNPKMLGVIQENMAKKLSVSDSKFRDRYQSALGSENNRFYEELLKSDDLREEFLTYNEKTDPKFDWNKYISLPLINEYAHQLGRVGRWLLSEELEIIAYVFNKKVYYYTADKALPLILNPHGAGEVRIRFNGEDHFERVESQERVKREINKNVKENKGLPSFLNNISLLSKMAAHDRKVEDDQEFLLEQKKHESKLDPQIKSLDELLNEMKGHKFNQESKIDIDKLRQQYEEIRKHEKQVVGWNQAEILAWANEMRGQLSGSSDFKDQLPEMIAVINRANYIATYDGTKGHTLRDTQLLAVLCMLEGKGKLAQIATGEGKSTIIAVLAVIKTLRGERVDIITSSPVLAIRDAQEKSDFYNLFGVQCTHNHREEKDKNEAISQKGMRPCYQAEIVYGSIHDFQFDYLDHAHRELETRGDRTFDNPIGVIVDEVDSMLVDNGGHIAKMSGPLPGMEHLLVLKFIIWERLKDCPDLKGALAITPKLKKRIEEIIEKGQYQDLRLMIPPQFKDYAKGQVNHWIQHALAAKYKYQADREYVIAKKEEEEVVVPVDYSNTGGLQNNTVWSDGLHQFVQIKEGLQVTAESLTTSFISNIAYIKLYKSNMMGLTGTLGSEDARRLLQESYDIDYAFIPTYKEKQLKPEEVKKSIHKGEEEWYSAITADVLSECSKGKAVLIICETILDARQVKAIFSEIGYSRKVMEFFVDSDINQISEQGKVSIDAGQIILSTNLSGRGMDIETSELVELNGGLHVCITFLPRNQRVEEQAIGRTARQGKKGSARLIIEEERTRKLINEALPPSEILEEPIDADTLKPVQAKIERYHLQHVREHELKKLNHEDSLFKEFSAFYRRLKKQLGDEFQQCDTAPFPDYLLSAAEEQWGLWLKRESRNTPDFGQFKSLIMDDKNRIKEATIHASYWVYIGNDHADAGDYQEAIQCYEKAIRSDPQCFAGHVQMGIAYIEMSKAIPSKVIDFLKAAPPSAPSALILESVFHIPDDKERKQLLEKAGQNFTKSHSIIDDYAKLLTYMCDQSTTGIVHDDRRSEQLSLTCCHLNSKIALLHYHQESISQAIDAIRSSKLNYVAIQNNRPFALDEIGERNSSIQEQIRPSSISDLNHMGFGNTFSVSEIKVIQPDLAKAAAIEIGAGLSIVGAGAASVAVPGIGLVVSNAAIGLGVDQIVSGLSDIIFALLFPNDPFDKNAFLKDKVTETATSLFFGVAQAISQIPKVFQLTSRAIRKMRKILPTSMQIQVMVKRSQAIGELLKARRTVTRLGKLEYVKQMAKSVASKIPEKLVKEVASNIVIDKALDALIAVVLENQSKTEEWIKNKFSTLLKKDAIFSEDQLVEIGKRVKDICLPEIEKIVSKVSGSIWSKIIEQVEFLSQGSIKGTLILKFASLYPQLIQTIVHDRINDENIKKIGGEINSGKYKNSGSKIDRDKLLDELTRLFLSAMNQHLAELIKATLKKFLTDAALEHAVNRLMYCFQRPKSFFNRSLSGNPISRKSFNKEDAPIVSSLQPKKWIEPRPEAKEPGASSWKERGKDWGWFQSLPDHGTTTAMRPATQHKIEADEAYHRKQGQRRNSDPELFGCYDPLKSFGLDQSAIEKKRHDAHFTNVGKRSGGINPQETQKKPRLSPVTSNRFYFDGSFFHYDPKQRPNNQNAHSVLCEVAKRQGIDDEFKRRVEAGEKKILSSMGLDMCHEHSAKSIGVLLAELGNPVDAKGQADDYRYQFAALAAQRLPEKKDQLMGFFDVFTDSKASYSDRVVALSDAIRMFNAAPNNLRPGYALTNRSIGARDDLAIEPKKYHLKHGDFDVGGAEATIPLSSVRNRAPQTILQELLGLKSRPPRKRQGADGIEIQSSSVGSDPKQAYIPIRRHSNPDLRMLEEAGRENPRRLGFS